MKKTTFFILVLAVLGLLFLVLVTKFNTNLTPEQQKRIQELNEWSAHDNIEYAVSDDVLAVRNKGDKKIRWVLFREDYTNNDLARAGFFFYLNSGPGKLWFVINDKYSMGDILSLDLGTLKYKSYHLPSGPIYVINTDNIENNYIVYGRDGVGYDSSTELHLFDFVKNRDITLEKLENPLPPGSFGTVWKNIQWISKIVLEYKLPDGTIKQYDVETGEYKIIK